VYMTTVLDFLTVLIYLYEHLPDQMKYNKGQNKTICSCIPMVQQHKHNASKHAK